MKSIWRRVFDSKKIWTKAEELVKFYEVGFSSIKVLKFYYPSECDWEVFYVGINFERDDIRSGHYADLPYCFVNLEDYK
jgi:hypothetical protein